MMLHLNQTLYISPAWIILLSFIPSLPGGGEHSGELTAATHIIQSTSYELSTLVSGRELSTLVSGKAKCKQTKATT